MPISKPTLLPKSGYVEVEISGKRTYRNVETGKLIEHETVLNDKQRIAILEEALAQTGETVMNLKEALEGQEQLRADIDYISAMTGVSL